MYAYLRHLRSSPLVSANKNQFSINLALIFLSAIIVACINLLAKRTPLLVIGGGPFPKFGFLGPKGGCTLGGNVPLPLHYGRVRYNFKEFVITLVNI